MANLPTAACAIDSALAFDLDHPLVERHLAPLDHATMNSSFELRVPFLSRECWHHALNMPIAERVGPLGKSTLRSMLVRTGLSGASDIAARKKVGLPGAFDGLARGARKWSQTVATHEQLLPTAADYNLEPYAAAWFSRMMQAYQELTPGQT